MNERDTKFRGFAKLLMLELGLGLENDFTRQLIAQRAYDLACHVIEHAKGDIVVNTEPYVKYNIPDLTQWPE